jgi:dipeptidyl aminopeptidase/acylaminoacyl peptidase
MNPESGPDPAPLFIFLGAARPQGEQEIMLLGLMETVNNQGNPQAWYLIAHLQWDEGWQNLRHSELISHSSENVFIPSYSPDGQYQIITTWDFNGETAQLWLRHLSTGEERRYELSNAQATSILVPQWSQDNRWLIYSSDNIITLIAPNEDYIHHIPHAFSHCNRTYYVPGE